MPTAQRDDSLTSDLAELESLPERFAALRQRLREVVVGQHEPVEQLLTCLFCNSHALLVGAPGLAKTLLVRTLAGALHLDFGRVQFTPDLTPGDVTGSEVLHVDARTGERAFRFRKGPIFANLVLADEINRAPPRTQAALLEAMAERRVTAGGESHPLPEPFVVAATQNPIEHEGAYPLPEAQLDRFFFSIRLDYPTQAEERRIAAEEDDIARRASSVRPLFDAGELLRIRALIGRMPVADRVIDEAVAITRASRPKDRACPPDLRPMIAWGASPRAAQAMLLAARCIAAFEGAPTPDATHVRRVALPALRHRIVPSYAAAAERVEADDIAQRIIDAASAD